ncbi:MAG: hypothetical protein Q4G39_04305 [Brachymonas sp.]|nr:hypothetical protein [Brachymonas sp.]
MDANALLNSAYSAFSCFDRPLHCINSELYEPERAEFEEILRGKSRENLLATDLGPTTWSPEHQLNSAAVAHFMPRLIELAITGAIDVDGSPYMMRFINAKSFGPLENRHSLFQKEQRSQVLHALEFLLNEHRGLIEEECWLQVLEEGISKWAST